MSDLQVGEDGKVNTRNSETGALQRLTPDQISIAPDYYQIVDDDAKPFEPGLFKPGKASDHLNPEPKTDAQLAAEAELAEVSEDHGPGSKAVKEAKAAVKDATPADPQPADEALSPEEGAK
jgi:hypothetical protein